MLCTVRAHLSGARSRSWYSNNSSSVLTPEAEQSVLVAQVLCVASRVLVPVPVKIYLFSHLASCCSWHLVLLISVWIFACLLWFSEPPVVQTLTELLLALLIKSTLVCHLFLVLQSGPARVSHSVLVLDSSGV